jgi:hypothetical protein
MASITVRQARVRDAKARARVHVQSWQETYRGLIPDEILYRPGFVEWREQFWADQVDDQGTALTPHSCSSDMTG